MSKSAIARAVAIVAGCAVVGALAVITVKAADPSPSAVVAYRNSVRPACERVHDVMSAQDQVTDGRERIDKALLIRTLRKGQESVRVQLRMVDDRDAPKELEDEVRRAEAAKEAYLASSSQIIDLLEQGLPAHATLVELEAIYTPETNEMIQKLGGDLEDSITEIIGSECELFTFPSS